MLWSNALSGIMVSLVGLGDFPDRLRMRHARPLTIADLPGCKDEESMIAPAFLADSTEQTTCSFEAA